MERLAGHVALVTGGAGGQGTAEAAALHANGARVAVADIRHDAAQEVARSLDPDGDDVIAVDLDVRSEESWQEAVAETVGKFGSLTVLVNNAATGGRGSLDTLTLGDWDAAMNTNARSIFIGVRAVLAPMRAAGGGAIVNISSAQAGRRAAFDPAYGASKGAVRQASRSMAVYLAAENIRVNTIYPGMIETPMVARYPLAGLAEHLPIRRLGRPDDIAGAVVFLASDEAAYIIGAEIVIDGGAELASFGHEAVRSVLQGTPIT